MAPLTHRIGLHFRSISLTRTPFETLLKGAELVYAQYGIKIEFCSGLSLRLSAADAKRLEVVDGQCNWKIESGEYRDVQKLGAQAPSTEILVFYVERFSDKNLLGCGGHMPGRPACIVAAQGSRWDSAHEIGHVLLGSHFSPVHSPDTRNLMYEYSSNSKVTPIFTNEQIQQIKKSPCCARI